MFSGKPIIGIAGGIGSGKSLVASMMAEMNCLVINSDEMARQAYKDPGVKQTLRQWWGKLVFDPTGEVDRSAVARKIFTLPSERQRLERLIHPIVNENRVKIMNQAAANPKIVAFVWDTPLLFETELNKLCDSVIYVDSPLEVRLGRLTQTRGWDQAELERRESAQMPLDKKKRIADYVVVNAADADQVRGQVREVLSRIVAKASPEPSTG
jgi:dephospho-CoA kinase